MPCLLVQPDSLTKERYFELTNQVDLLTEKAWGSFGKDFIVDHVFKAQYLALYTHGSSLIGYGAVSIKKYALKNYYYFEFLVVDPEHQKRGIGKKIYRKLFFHIAFKSLCKLQTRIDCITITPNPRIIGMISRISSFMYPDPKIFNKTMSYPDADNETWLLAREVLSQSYNPNRALNRRGLVLSGSYDDSQWLIYKRDNVPMDYDENINLFCATLLNYGSEKGDEFIVIFRVNIFRVLTKIFV